MKKAIIIVCYCLIGVFTLAPNTLWGQEAYLSLAQDIPLAPGLAEEQTRAVIFDKPQGRIIRMVAITDDNTIAAETISRFYQTTLPNLGWVRDDRKQDLEQDLRFRRDGEALSIRFIKGAAHQAIFEITPF